MTDQTAQDDEALDLTLDEYAELTEAEPHARQIVYSGQDFDVQGLVRRLENGDIKIPQFGHHDPEIETPGFQRGFVWTRSQMDKFIESLLLGYPIPGIFLVRQRDRLYIVLDGQQRLTTLKAFYEGVHQGHEFKLANVSDSFVGLTYRSLPTELRRTLDNSFIQATIVDVDGSQESLEAAYQIFERLNSGGTLLTPHEIRVALYAGPFVDLLDELNHSEDWRSLYGVKSARIRDQELILRIIAMYKDSDNYSRPLKVFLNGFVGENRDAEQVAAAADLFRRASRALATGPGPAALRKAAKQVNAAQTEAIFVGLMRRLERGEVTPAGVNSAVEALRDDTDFDMATGRATADEEAVITRLRVATEAFSSVP